MRDIAVNQVERIECAASESEEYDTSLPLSEVASSTPIASRAAPATPERLTAREAAMRLGYARRTASIRAQRAYAAGDPGVNKEVKNGTSVWMATLQWWEELLKDPPRRGYSPAPDEVRARRYAEHPRRPTRTAQVSYPQ